MAESSTSLNPTKGEVYLVIVLAAGSIVFASLYMAAGHWPFRAPLWGASLLSVLLTAPLLYRRRFPSYTAWLQCIVYSVGMVTGTMEPGVSQVILFMGIYSIGAWQRHRRAAFVSRILLCFGMLVLFIVSMTIQYSELAEMTVIQYAASAGVSFLINVVFFGGAWLFGNRAWNQRLLLAELRAADEEVRSQGQRLADQALDLERVRIARELHDGVAHHIAGVGIHAAAARRSLAKNPDKAAESLQTIESSTRETVEELRALVYTLRDTDETVTEAATAKGNPGLGDVPELIESARGTGQRIEFTTIGEARALTPITEMSIYRVIQESLTNCSRYAGPGAEVDVRLRYGGTDLEVEISDARSPGADHPDITAQDAASAEAADRQTGLGLGIVGMRERMNALGGSLEAGEKSRGGWLVRARIPYPHAPEADHLAAETTGAGSDARSGPDTETTDAADARPVDNRPVDTRAKA